MQNAVYNCGVYIVLIDIKSDGYGKCCHQMHLMAWLNTICNDKMQRMAWLLMMCVDPKYSSAQAASLQRMVCVVHIPCIV